MGRRYPPPLVRLLSRVEKQPNGCWQWTGSDNGLGYGQLMCDGRLQVVHRVAYEQIVGPIPNGLTLDHLCRNTRCVNPSHLEPVSMKENILRGYGPSAVSARKTHCKYGHELSPGDGRRVCHTCERRRRREWLKRNREKNNVQARERYRLKKATLDASS